MPKKQVLFARVAPEARAWALEKAKASEGVSAGLVVERLLLNDKKKILALRESRKNGKSAA